jgi:hypothetical protein
MTDCEIDVRRGEVSDRRVVHSLQPNAHYIGAQHLLENRLERLGAGEIDCEEVWSAFLDILPITLDGAALLLENVDADRTAITADHGGRFGRIGFHSRNIGCLHLVVPRFLKPPRAASRR